MSSFNYLNLFPYMFEKLLWMIEVNNNNNKNEKFMEFVNCKTIMFPQATQSCPKWLSHIIQQVWFGTDAQMLESSNCGAIALVANVACWLWTTLNKICLNEYLILVDQVKLSQYQLSMSDNGLVRWGAGPLLAWCQTTETGSGVVTFTNWEAQVSY